ncbi:MAG: tetratricopeptide repeat protein [Chloroflexi bacterium]|nr:tetratricopeptide repeat protein [Chloroflexota bacterium]
MSSFLTRFIRTARALPELWLTLAVAASFYASRPFVPADVINLVGWTINAYQVFALLTAFLVYLLSGFMFLRWARVGGSWLTRIPTAFAAATGLWSIPGLVVAATARFPLTTLVYSGLILTGLLALAAFVREYRSPAGPTAEENAAAEGRADWGRPLNIGLAVLGLAALGVMTWVSLNAPVSNDDNLQLMYTQDNLVARHINEFEPIFGIDIHPNTRGSLTTWPVNLALFAFFSGLAAQQSFWILRTVLVIINVLGFYTLNLRFFGKRNHAILATLIYCLIAVIFTTDLDGVGFGMFARTAQDKYVVRYALLPVALAWSLAYLGQPRRSVYWLAGVIIYGQGCTHPVGPVLLAFPLGGLGLLHIINHAKGIDWALLWPPRWRAAVRAAWDASKRVGVRGAPAALWRRGWELLALNRPMLQPFVLLAIFPLATLVLPLAAQASPDAPVVAYSLVDTRDPSLFFRVSLAVNNYRLLINNAFGEGAYVVHPRVFLSSIILLAVLFFPLMWWKARKRAATEMIIGAYILNPIALLTPPLIQYIGSHSSPWLLYRFAWGLSLLGPVVLGWAAWVALEFISARVSWPAARQALPAAAFIVAVLVLSPDIRTGLTYLHEIRIDPALSRCRTLQPVFGKVKTSIGSGATIIATPDLDLCLPAAVGNAYPVEFGLSSTINRFPKSRITEGEQRFYDDFDFTKAQVVDRDFMDILTRWNVGFILLRQDSPLASQLRHLPGLFELQWEESRYSFYRVRPGIGVDIQPGLPPRARWKQVSWAGDDPVIDANSLWTDAKWQQAIDTYRALETAPGADTNTRYLALIGEARALQSSGRLDEAIAVYQAAAKMMPNDVGAQILLGNAYWLKGDYALSVAANEAAVQLANRNPVALQRLGVLYHLLGRDDDARDAFIRFSSVDFAFGTVNYYRTLGTTYLSANMVDDAIATFQKSNKIRETTYAYYYLAQAYIQENKLVEARQAGNNGQRVEIWDDVPYVALGAVDVREGKSDQAISHLKKAVFRDPQSSGLTSLIATLAYSQGNEAALGMAQKLVGYRLGFSVANLAAAQAELATGDVITALKLGEQSFQWDLTNSPAGVFLGNTEHMLGHDDQAEHYYSEAIRLYPYNAQAYMGRSAVAQARGNWGVAEGWAWSGMTASPYDSTAVTALGNLYAGEGDSATALLTFRRASVVAPTDPGPYLAAGKLYLSMGQSPEHLAALNIPTAAVVCGSCKLASVKVPPPALTPYDYASDPAAGAQAAYEAASRLETQSNLSYVGLGNLALASGDLQSAIAYYEKAVALSPFDGDSLVSLGNVYRQAGRLDDAVKTLLLAAQKDPGYINAYDSLGSFYLSRAQRQQATDAFEQAIKQLPWKSNGYVNLGNSLETLGQTDDARKQYQAATSLDPREAAAAQGALAQLAETQGDYRLAELYYRQAGTVDLSWMLSLAQMYTIQGRHDDARRLYYQVTPLLPAADQANAYTSLSSLSLTEGHSAQAIDEARQALSSYPTYLPAYTALAQAFNSAGQTDQAALTYQTMLKVLPGSSDAYVAYGDYLRGGGHWADALAAYNRAARLAPGSSDPPVSIGDTYRAQGKFAEALPAYQKAVAAEPSNVDAQLGLGQMYETMARYDEAAAAFAQAADWDRTRTEGLMALGALEVKRNNVDAAVSAYTRAIAIHPTAPEPYVSLGNLRLSQAQPIEALKNFQQAVTIAPASGLAWQSLGSAQLAQGQLNNARASFEKAIAVEPAYMQAYAGLGNMQWQQGLKTEAEKTFRAAIAVNAADPAGHLSLGQLLSTEGRFNEAEAVLQTGIKATDGNAQLYTALANFYLLRGKNDLALANFQQSVEVAPGSATALVFFATAQAQWGHLAEAEALYQSANQVEPFNGSALHSTGDFQTYHGQFALAEASYRRAMLVDPNYLDNYAGLADLLTLMGRASEVQAIYDAAIAAQPGSTQGYIAKGDYLRSRGRWQDALELYRQAGVVQPSAPEPWLAMGDTYRGRADKPNAIAAYNKAVALSPSQPDPFIGLGIVYETQADFDVAINFFSTAAQLDQTRNDGLLNIASVQLQHNDLAGAIATYQQAIQARLDDPGAYLALGQLYQGQLKLDEARAQFQKAVDVAPQSGLGWEGLGNYYLQLSDVTNAFKNFRQSVAVDPGYLPSYIDMGSLYRTLGDPANAEAMFRAAIAANASDPSGYINLGQLLQAQAQFDEAEKQYQLGVEATPGSGQALAALGNFYLTRNRPADAINALQKGVEIDPGFLGSYTRLAQTNFLFQALFGLAQTYQFQAQFATAEQVLQSAQQVDASSPDAYLGLAKLYISTNRIADAQRMLDQGLAVAPSSSSLYITRGDIALGQGDFASAETYYKKGIEVQPASPEPYLSLASAYSQQTLWDKSAQAYQQVEQIASLDTRSYVGLAQMYLSRGQNELARQAAEKAVQQGPVSGAARVALGDYYTQVGNLNKAQEFYIEAMQIEPTYAAAYSAAGDGYRVMGTPAKAEATYKLAMQIVPVSPDAFLSLGRLYLSQGQNAAATGILLQATQVAPASGDVWHDLANTYLLTGQFGPAAADYRQGILVAPTLDSNYLGLGQLQLRQGAPAQAEQSFNAGLAAHPTSSDLLAALGGLRAQQGDLGAARDYYRRGALVVPANTQGRINYAQFLLTQGEVSAALAQYQTAVDINTRSDQAWSGLGDVYQNLGRYADAAHAYATAINTFPDLLITAYGGLDNAYAMLGRPDAALPVYQRALAAFPGSSLPAWAIGNVYRSRGDLPTAKSYYLRALQSEPGNVQTRIDLADVLQLQGDWASAKAQLDSAIALQGGNVSAWLALGDGWLAQGYADQAANAYNKAITLDLSSSLPYQSLGALAESQNNPSLAVSRYQQAIAIAPNSLSSYMLLGSVYQRMDNLDSALATYAQAEGVNRSQADPWLMHGQLTLSKNPDDPDLQATAQADYNQAIAVEPGNVDGYLQMAALYRLQNSVDQSKGQIDTALAVAPGYSPAYVARGEWWHAQSKFNEAIADYERAAQLDGTDTSAYDLLVNVYDNYNIYVDPPCIDNPLTGETRCAGFDPDAPSALPDHTPAYEAMSAADPSAAWLHGILSQFYQQPEVYSASAAVKHLEFLVNRYPQFAAYHSQLAQLYQQLGQSGNARRQWNLYLALAFKDPERVSAQASLSHVSLIIDPVLVEAWNPLVTIHGTADIQNFESYQLDWGAGESPADWHAIAGPVTRPVYNDSLGLWDTTGLAAGTYTVRLTAADTLGMQQFYFVTVTLTR